MIDYDIGGTGTMYFKANTTNNANIIQDHIDVNSGVTLVNEGDILISESSKKLAIASMSVGEYVSDHSTGETIFSQMKNDGLAVHSIINNGAIVNNGTLEGSLENNGNVTGEGSLYLHGNSINASNTTI